LNVEFKELQGPGLADYVNVVRRRIWYVVVPFVLCSIAALGIAFLVPKEYKAMTEVIVDDPDSMVGSAYAPVGITVPHKHLLTTISQDVHSVDFLDDLIRDYGITEGYNPADPREKKKLFERVRKRLEALTTTQKVGPDLVTFSYVGRNAELVTRFINGLRTKWQDEFLKRYTDAIAAIEDNILKVYEEANLKYLKAASDLRNFQEEAGVDFFGKDAGANARARLEKLKVQLEEDELGLQAAEATLRTQTEQLRRYNKLSTVETSKKRNPDWIKQSALVEAGEAALREMQRIFSDEWPKVQEAKRRLEDERNKLGKIEEFITDSVQQGVSQQWIKLTNEQTETQTDIARLKQRIEKTKKLVEKLETDVLIIPEKAARAQVLRDAVDTTAIQLEKAVKAREIASATRERAGTRTFFRVTMAQDEKDARFAEPVYPNYALFAGIGAFLGLLIGGAIAFIGEYSAAAFTTPSQVRYMLQVPILGEVAPMITRYDVRKRTRRRGVFLAITVLLLLVIVVLHVMFFDPDWRASLPPFLRDLMRRVYGVR
jgi:uncharacterized protein involved in exopolysaccharide biosynthesis